MYLNKELRKVSTSGWHKYVAKQVTELVVDLRRSDCVSLNVFRGMVEKVLNEAGLVPHERVEVLQLAILNARRVGNKGVVTILEKMRI